MNPSDLSRFDPLHGGCYPGGKAGSGVAQRIVNLMPPHEVYIEPFLGGGAVLRAKRPATLNVGIDCDPSVSAAWCAAAPQFSQAPAGDAKARDSRRRPPRSPAPLNTASLPATPLKSAAHPDPSQKSASPDPAGGKRGTRSRPGEGAGHRWRFLCADGIEFLRNYPWTGRELVYCDPPYVHSQRRDLKLYSHEMTAAQHAALLVVLQRIPCPVLISGYRSDMYALGLRKWHSLDYPAMTRRGLVTETLWHNFPPPVELHDYRYLGADRRERERIRRMQTSWTRRLAALDALERRAMLSVLNAVPSTAAECAGAHAPSARTNRSSL